MIGSDQMNNFQGRFSPTANVSHQEVTYTYESQFIIKELVLI